MSVSGEGERRCDSVPDSGDVAARTQIVVFSKGRAMDQIEAFVRQRSGGKRLQIGEVLRR